MPKKTELIHLQGEPSDIQPDIARTETNLVLQAKSIQDRMRHFPSAVYDLSAESKFVKFLKVLLGDAGAGQLRKHILMQRLSSTLQGSHFYNLDRFYGPLFGVTRNADEVLNFDPYTEPATRDQWAIAHSKDTSFRSRIEQFSRALLYGPTPTGIELIAEALLSVDVDVYESWVQADRSFQTYQELEDQFGVNLFPDQIDATSIETTSAYWLATTNISLVSQSSLWSFPDGFTAGGGTQSLRLVCDGVGDAESHYNGSEPVTAGNEYTFAGVTAFFGYLDPQGSPGELFLESDESLGDLVRTRMRIDWYASGPSFLSSDVGGEVWPDDLAQGVSVTATAPGGAETAVPVLEILGPEANDEIFFDRLEFSLLNYGDMEGVSYGDLEGLGLPRLSGDERRIFFVRPKRPITLAESYDLSKVLHKIKPADSRFVIEAEGVNLYDPVDINGAYSDSEYWEIVPKVTSLATFTNEPYQVVSGEPEEQPLPPFSGYQGEAWSYITDLAGVIAYSQVSIIQKPTIVPQGCVYNEERGILSCTMPVSRVVYDNGDLSQFQAEQAMLPSRMVYAGRAVSDAIAIAWPYVRTRSNRQDIESERDPTPFYIDSVPIQDFLLTLSEIPDVDPFQQNIANRYWVTPERDQTDTTDEVLEVRLNRNSWVNYVTFEAVRYPHRAIVETFNEGEGEWEEALRWTYHQSSPRVLSPGRATALKEGHPDHAFEGHFERVRHNFDEPKLTSRVRVRLRRTEGEAPLASQRQDAPTVQYSLALRGLDVGYRVRSREDFDFISTDEIGSTKDAFGSQLTFEAQDRLASSVLTNEQTFWKSNPQPVNYGVVNLYLDTRDGSDGKVIDRFGLNPIHDGAHLSIYYSMDINELDDDDPNGFFENLKWIPIPRDFTVQKGNIYIPPTRARYWKFEFTSLNIEMFENFLPIEREVKLFPRWIVDQMITGSGHAEEALLPGMKAAINVADSAGYADAIGILQQTTVDTEEFKPTESRYITDVNVANNMADKTWVYRFTPWHQEQSAPRFATISKHVYETAKIRHTAKAAFFVGLRELKAYRANWEVNDDPTVYFDTFDDFRNLEPGFDWTFEPGYLTSEGTSPPVQVESRTFLSKSPVSAIQFATEQSSPVQLIPDPEFRNPTLLSYNFDDTDSYTKVGDATIIYNQSDFSVRIVRFIDPPSLPIDVEPGMVQQIPWPVFSWRAFELTGQSFGGLRSPLMGLSDEGRAHAAVRFTMLTPQTDALKLQVIKESDESVIAELNIEARQNQQVEKFLSFEIPEPSLTVRIQLIQEGNTADSWKIFSMSMFDDGMVWEFSVNGGGDWYNAKEIRNNDNGILTFPAPGNQLRYRARAFREGRWVSAIKMRPHYLGAGNARGNGTHRGSNVSYYDQDVPIHEDPMFTTWKRPVPFWWFAASRRFPLLSIDGAITSNEFNSFFGRPFDEDLSGNPPVIEVTREITRVRNWEEELFFTGPDINLARVIEAERDIGENIAEPSIGVAWSYVSGLVGGSPVHPQIDPVFSTDDDAEDSVEDAKPE